MAIDDFNPFNGEDEAFFREQRRQAYKRASIIIQPIKEGVEGVPIPVTPQPGKAPAASTSLPASIPSTNSNFVSFDITDLSKRIRDIIQRAVVPDILTLASEEAAPLIKDEMVEALYRTQFFQDLIHPNGIMHDPAAHFGFYPQYQNLVMREMVEALRSTAEVGIASVNDNIITYNFNASLQGNIQEQMIHITDAQYIGKEEKSSWSDRPVSWMQWLLYGGNVKAAITYSPGGIINKRTGEKRESRSGRAIMTESNDSHPSWDIDTYNKFAENDNFVEDLLNDKELPELIHNIIYKKINDVSRKKVFRVGYGGSNDAAPF